MWSKLVLFSPFLFSLSFYSAKAGSQLAANKKSWSRDKATFAWLSWSCLRITLYHWSGGKGASWLVPDVSNRKVRFLQTDASPGSVLAPLVSWHNEGALNAHKTAAQFKFKGFIIRTCFSDTRETFDWLDFNVNVFRRDILKIVCSVELEENLSKDLAGQFCSSLKLSF